MFKVAERILDIPQSPIRKLIPHADAAKERGVHVYHLNIGQPDIETPELVMNAIKNFEPKVLSYGPSQGIAPYRKKLIEYYEKWGIDLDIEDLIVTTAGSEAILFAFMAITNPGDEIIVPEPYYANYNGIAHLCGIKIVPVTSHIENGFALPPIEEFEKKITNKTKAIMVCSPNNPTGGVYSRKEMEEVREIALRHNLFIISDEVYREFSYDGAEVTSILGIEGTEECAILVDSVSKRYSMCGARIGCIVTKNKELNKYILRLAQARLCPPTIEQYASMAAIDLDDGYFREMKEEYQKRRDYLHGRLSAIDGVVCSKSKGAFYLVAKLPVENAEEFAIFMLDDFNYNKETVMFAPAEGFYATPGLGRDEIRMAYVLNVDDLEKAMNIFEKGLSEFLKLKK